METEHQIRDQIIVACSSSKFRKRLLTETNLTLEKTLNIGRIMESANHHTKEIENHKETQDSLPELVNQMTVKSHHHRKPFMAHNQSHSQSFNHSRQNQPPQITCGRCGATGHPSQDCRRSKGKSCSKCGKVGHFAKMCRSRPTDDKPNQQRRNHNLKMTEHQLL